MADPTEADGWEKVYRKTLDMLKSARAATEWRSFDTAPKDGTWIQVLLEATGQRPAIVVSAYWGPGHLDEDEKAWLGPYSDGYDTEIYFIGTPTHWREIDV